MKNLFYSLALALLCACATNPKTDTLADGFYLVQQLGNDSTDFGATGDDKKLVDYDHTFADSLPQSYNKVLVMTDDFVPLQLSKIPEVITSPANKKLQISLNQFASARIKDITSKNLLKQAVIILDGKAVSLHKIRAVIEGPGMEITGCSDIACEKLALRMKNNVEK